MALPETTSTSTVDVDGVQVTLHDTVDPRDGERPLVLVHGTGGTAASHFGQIIPHLSRQRRVIAADWADTPGEKLELDELVRQVVATTNEAIGPDAEFDIAGFSLGAVVAVAVAAAEKGRVKNLIPVAGWAATDNQQRLRNGVWRTLYEENPATVRRFMGLCAFSPVYVAKTDAEEFSAGVEALTVDAFVAKQMDLNARVDIREAAETVTATTLIIANHDDFMVPRHHSQQLFGLIEDSRYTEVTSGHMVVLERPAEVVQLIDLFLREPQRYPAGTVVPETEG
ncbi:alpha/beta fold hydrolase [Corynebacterium auris]|uniref:alpha/beta fold hydrolase n=1 Tax=Corynebacterium auris TaxID=44750 RepID=UPI0025B4EAFE|nr:alpha/beta hydrolase [Corynebacterium auris]WJY68796.1 Putative aminoacrylate hydrolase RutD [Corynebacterium auris]